MLDRVALHQTRLRTPGISLDAKGVALGAKGLVLLPSIDRLVGFLALYTAGASLADLLDSLTIQVVKSKLGGREMVLSFRAEASDRMDRVAELARASGGYTFTGTSRHFVQYRDAAAPFGYDVSSIAPTDAPLALYHDTFSQHYAPERDIDLAALLLRLEPRVAPSTLHTPEGGAPRWICAETGLGPALIHYFVRSLVRAEVGVAEWPPASGFDEAPLRRYLFRVEQLPERMVALLRRTPGIDVFAPTGPGSAVEIGYQHPVNLRACPVFAEDGLVLIRGAGRAPIHVNKLPALGPVAAFAKVKLREDDAARSAKGGTLQAVSVPLRLAPDTQPWRQITASLVGPSDLGLLRLIAYRLSAAALRETRVAFTPHGAFLHRSSGIEAIPVGELFRQVHPQIYVAAGYLPVPAVAPSVLHRALGAPDDELVFVRQKGERVGVAKRAFVALEDALLDALSWSGTTSEPVVASLQQELPLVQLDDPGFRPMRDVDGGEEG
jgi:hypothetical protein